MTVEKTTVKEVYNLINDSSLTEGANIIRSCEIERKFANQIWHSMVKDAIESKTTSKEEYNEYRKEFEIEILKKRLDSGDESVLRTPWNKESWIFTKVCKNSSYRSNKSILGRAIDSGIELIMPEGTIKTKAMINKETKEADGIKTVPRKIIKTILPSIPAATDINLVKIDINNLVNKMNELGPIDKTIVITYLGEQVSSKITI